ncbi:MAG: tetratricopeptide repeat protein [Gammaproteobacteria bacterium]
MRQSEPQAVAAQVQRAMQLHRQGSLREAASICETVLRQEEGNFDALHLLGVIHLQSGMLDTGLGLVEKAIAQRPGEAMAHLSKGNALLSLERPQAALEAYDLALGLQPQSAVIHNNRGNALLALERADEAQASFDRALQLDPNHVSAHVNCGNVLIMLGRADDAIVALDRAIQLDPRNAAAHCNRGRALLSLERATEALVSHDRALALNPRLVEGWTNKGNTLLELNHPAEALACYERALQLRPGYFNARHNVGQALLGLRRPADALAAIDAVLETAPHDPKALLNRGLALLHLGRKEEAAEHLRSALAVVPDQPDMLSALANAQMSAGRHADAEQTFTRLLGVKPGYDYAPGSLCEMLLQRCNWRELAGWEPATLAAVRAGQRAAPPFTLLALRSDPADQASCARAFVERVAPLAMQRSSLRGYRHNRIRLAYVSADFREHPVANQIVRLLETHDRSRFEVICVALERQDGSDVAKRVRAGCDRFLDVAHMTEQAIAELLRGFEADIAIDLSGHTFGGRTAVFAHRAAPVQVNYLGYPGTLATACHDYIVADPWVIPEGHEAHYMERIATLPHSYQPCDPRIEAAKCSITRSEAGLPADAFVYCNFNNRFKIHPEIFDVWMRILSRVPGAVLWLGESARAVEANLRSAALARGVDPERLLFAERMDSRDQHIARYQLADLFLDTLPFNAHATASDALWAGLPLLTCVGRGFAGRVAAGMLSAVALPELISRDLHEYEEKAVALARRDSELSELRARLVGGRGTHPLFDLDRYRRNLEQAYERMTAEVNAGRPPSSFAVVDEPPVQGQVSRTGAE